MGDLTEVKTVLFQTNPIREINAVEITLHDILSGYLNSFYRSSLTLSRSSNPGLELKMIIESSKLNKNLAPSTIDHVAEEELTILYIMNAAREIQSNYLGHVKGMKNLIPCHRKHIITLLKNY